jgi:hypothetical protein
MKATQRLINSVWTCEFNVISDTEVEIVKHTREDPEGYEKEEEFPNFSIKETVGRVAVQLLIKEYKAFGGFVNLSNAEKVYTIINPKYIFDYN